MIPESIRALDDARGSAEEFPVYQATVLAEPFLSDVAEPNGAGVPPSAGGQTQEAARTPNAAA